MATGAEATPFVTRSAGARIGAPMRWSEQPNDPGTLASTFEQFALPDRLDRGGGDR